MAQRAPSGATTGCRDDRWEAYRFAIPGDRVPGVPGGVTAEPRRVRPQKRSHQTSGSRRRRQSYPHMPGAERSPEWFRPATTAATRWIRGWTGHDGCRRRFDPRVTHIPGPVPRHDRRTVEGAPGSPVRSARGSGRGRTGTAGETGCCPGARSTTRIVVNIPCVAGSTGRGRTGVPGGPLIGRNRTPNGSNCRQPTVAWDPSRSGGIVPRTSVGLARLTSPIRVFPATTPRTRLARRGRDRSHGSPDLFPIE